MYDGSWAGTRLRAPEELAGAIMEYLEDHGHIPVQTVVNSGTGKGSLRPFMDRQAQQMLDIAEML